MSQCFTSPNYWGYNLQQIFEGDVKQIPKKRHLPTPDPFVHELPYRTNIHVPGMSGAATILPITATWIELAPKLPLLLQGEAQSSSVPACLEHGCGSPWLRSAPGIPRPHPPVHAVGKRSSPWSWPGRPSQAQPAAGDEDLHILGAGLSRILGCYQWENPWFWSIFLDKHDKAIWRSYYEMCSHGSSSQILPTWLDPSPVGCMYIYIYISLSFLKWL